MPALGLAGCACIIGYIVEVTEGIASSVMTGTRGTAGTLTEEVSAGNVNVGTAVPGYIVPVTTGTGLVLRTGVVVLTRAGTLTGMPVNAAL
jgi:hypothetical protein